MLAKVNRIVLADDYRSIVRRGRRTGSAHALVYIRRHSGESTVRFGFIVAKTVGDAVRRNLVRRRLKSVTSALLPTLPAGTDIVIRALPGAAQASWATLNSEITEVVGKGMARA